MKPEDGVIEGTAEEAGPHGASATARARPTQGWASEPQRYRSPAANDSCGKWMTAEIHDDLLRSVKNDG